MKNLILRCLYAGLFILAFTIIEAQSIMHLGVAERDITPPLPVALDGQMYLRIAKEIETPLMANILILENSEEGRTKDLVVFVSLDLVSIPDELRAEVRRKVLLKVPDIQSEKIILSATHTHTAAVVRSDLYIIPDGVTSVEETIQFISDQISDGIREAWESREGGTYGFGLGHAVVGKNRRASYIDGKARMYGATSLYEFKGIEGYEDHDINVLFFWNDNNSLAGICINVTCPAQEVEHRYSVNADYWHVVRKILKEKFGNEVVILGWIGAAGDQSPHLLYNETAENRMIEMRGIDRMEEIARRIVNSVEDVYSVVKNNRSGEYILDHEVRELYLPRRWVTRNDFEESKEAIAEYESLSSEDRVKYHRRKHWNEGVVHRYKDQEADLNKTYSAEVHVVRIGDVVICTNPFELFTEYGIRMKSRSKALQTFVIQLAGSGTYLPTREALKGGHYSAIVQSNEVGPDGGDLLVEETLKLIELVWDNN